MKDSADLLVAWRVVTDPSIDPYEVEQGMIATSAPPTASRHLPTTHTDSVGSLVDDEGVDLVFHRREKSTTLAVQVKSRTMATKGIGQRNRFYATVGAATFRPRADLYLLFVP